MHSLTATGGDPFDLDRFVQAQAGTYAAALAEVRGGAKRSHWMWFVFPQVAGLGRSATAEHYAVRSLAEAQAYLAHPLLGARLRECVDAVLALRDTDAETVFGPVDAVKLRSSLTLFAEASGEPRFAEALRHWFDGRRDDLTHRLLRP